MQSYGMTLMLKDDEEIVERYRRYHRDAWPEVIARLRDIGIVEMRIYLVGRRLFMYMEAVDGFAPERDFPKLAEDSRYREWDELMRGLQRPAPEARAGEWWAPMEEVFDLSGQ
jgi:L-rhamnose mutarotase